MKKLIAVLFSISFIFFFSAGTVLADTPCCPASGYTTEKMVGGNWVCRSKEEASLYISAPLCTASQKCQDGSCRNLTGTEEVFGKIQPPAALAGLTNQGGAGGVSTVLTNLIDLIITVAIILFIFMVIFSALQWITSGGDKEKVANARGRLTNAIIGLLILGLAFVIANVLGTITGISLPFK